MPTTLITGASTGLGAAFARKLAAQGHTLTLVARSVDRLERLADELAALAPARPTVLAADLSTDDGVASIEAWIAEHPLDLLINNAGFGTWGRFDELPVQGELEEIRLNVEAVVRLTRAALPAQVARGRGAILNVSSLGGFQPAPKFATYVATKAFVTSFSESIHAEVAPLGVTVTALCPGFTRTEFQRRAGMSEARLPEMFWMQADEVVERALIDLDARRALSITGFANRLAMWVSTSLPRSAVRWVAGHTMSLFEK
jgi:short-subunit dehydrogenase